MSACLLLDPFLLYLEMPVVCSSYIQPLETAALLGMKMCWRDFWGGERGGGGILIRM